MFIIIYLIIIIFFIEIFSRIIFIFNKKTYKNKNFITAILNPLDFNYTIFENFGQINKNLVKNEFRFDSQIDLMKINRKDFIKNLALVNQTTPEKIYKAYSGYSAFEKLDYEPFIGLFNKKDYELSYAKINSNSFQDTFKKQTSKRIKRVMIVGGSVAFGFGTFNKKNNLTNLLDKYLNTQESNINITWEILNFSFISSQSTSEMNLLNKYVSKYKPDYIIQLSGFNDLYFYLNNNLQSYTFNQSNLIKDYLYSSLTKKIIIKISTYSFLFKILLKLSNLNNDKKQKNNLYTIY